MMDLSNNEVKEERDLLLGGLTRKAQDARVVAAAFKEIASEIEGQLEGPQSQKPLLELAKIEVVRWCREQSDEYTTIQRSILARLSKESSVS